MKEFVPNDLKLSETMPHDIISFKGKVDLYKVLPFQPKNGKIYVERLDSGYAILVPGTELVEMNRPALELPLLVTQVSGQQ